MTEQSRHMLVEDFEEIAASAPETVTLEFISWRIREKCVGGGSHASAIAWLVRRMYEARPDLYLCARLGLVVEKHRKGRAVPDAVLAPARYFLGDGAWSEAEGILMAVEVTAYDHHALHSDREERPVAYAGVGIPVYLLVDRDAGAVVVHSGPESEHGYYRHRRIHRFGEKITLPEPVGIPLDTEPLKKYVR
ncbi:Uma2 family endonuclease [Streptomyces luteolus]|uniref:Uma2 family endonuclease n=1 Tax=Streptomyces luteolus TaxID=3043615 RepID=A0ABT6SXN3_9ACTN|nr:Uma2 family endonuclease [Streptomyces sp. B-S-A12]MDI3420351.1 Uma2 family endonuclease [Streptomyces sp. B-S-A12]